MNNKVSNIEEIEIKIASGKIRGLAWGSKNGMPILATHGWLDNAASFLPLTTFLTDYRIVAIDLPGHGFSDHKPHGSYVHFMDYIPDIIQVLEALKWDKCSLLGHSLGGAIFTLIAGIIPNRVTKLGLIDVLGPYSVSANKAPEIVANAIKHYLRLKDKNLPEYDTIEEAIQKRKEASPMADSSVKHLVDRGLQLLHDNKYRWRTDPRLLIKSMIMLSEEQIDSFLERITSPVCVIRAKQGWPFTEESFQRRVKIVKNIQVHNVEGLHHVHMDNPKLIANILNNFFKQ